MLFTWNMYKYVILGLKLFHEFEHFFLKFAWYLGFVAGSFFQKWLLESFLWQQQQQGLQNDAKLYYFSWMGSRLFGINCIEGCKLKKHDRKSFSCLFGKRTSRLFIFVPIVLECKVFPLEFEAATKVSKSLWLESCTLHAIFSLRFCN